MYAVKDPDDLEDQSEMLLAATLAGRLTYFPRHLVCLEALVIRFSI
jgi:hypothetical protein